MQTLHFLYCIYVLNYTFLYGIICLVKKIMAKIGPFFYINNKLIYNACDLDEGREQAGKLDNSYSHEMLYDDNFSSGDYIDYPRGRVIWDKEKSKAIIYIDPCIDKKNVLDEIAEAFKIGEYVTASDFHYHCKNCSDALFDDMDW